MMKKIVVILIHGYNVIDPRRTVAKLRPYFEERGCLVENYTYGYVPLPVQLTIRNPKLAAEVHQRCLYWAKQGCRVFVACHSNGAAITRIASVMHFSPIERVLAIHPALRRDLDPCPSAQKIIVVHNQGDRAVVAGGILGRFARWVMPDSWTTRPWGQMGQDGYQGKEDPRITNVDTASGAFPVEAWGHSDEFKSENCDVFWPTLADQLLSG